MGSVDDLLSWRARVRDVHHLREVFKQDDGRVSVVEEAVIALREDIGATQKLLIEAVDIVSSHNLKLIELERSMHEFRSRVAHEFTVAGDELIKGAK